MEKQVNINQTKYTLHETNEKHENTYLPFI